MEQNSWPDVRSIISADPNDKTMPRTIPQHIRKIIFFMDLNLNVLLLQVCPKKKEHGEYFLILITSIYNQGMCLDLFHIPEAGKQRIRDTKHKKKNKNNYLLLQLFMLSGQVIKTFKQNNLQAVLAGIR